LRSSPNWLMRTMHSLPSASAIPGCPKPSPVSRAYSRVRGLAQTVALYRLRSPEGTLYDGLPAGGHCSSWPRKAGKFRFAESQTPKNGVCASRETLERFLRKHGFRKDKEGVKKLPARNFGSSNPLRIHVGARHGVPLQGFFHTLKAFPQIRRHARRSSLASSSAIWTSHHGYAPVPPGRRSMSGRMARQPTHDEESRSPWRAFRARFLSRKAGSRR
jgi:hypothetical protein